MRQNRVIGMAGAGGDGIVAAGEALIHAAARQGYYAVMTKSFGSQIRGGESSCRVRLSTSPVHCSGGVLDIAVALSWDDFLKFGAELPVGGATVVVYDTASGVLPEVVPLVGVRPAEVISAPITDLAMEAAGSERAKNTVVLGMLARWLGLEAGTLLQGIRHRLERKGLEVVAAAERAFGSGLAYAAEHPLALAQTLTSPQPGAPPKILADGNTMCAAAALFAGCRFFGGYPITPSSEIMQVLSREIWKYGGALLQAEDEIAGVAAAVGASFAGSKAMTATSGPGMSLKTEILGLASIAELPLVIVNVQRGGPSTGMPTKSEQSDLFQAVFSAHGDVVRPVLAPTGVGDTFATTVEAFNLAERYQTPVIILSDQEIAQRKESLDRFEVADLRVEERQLPSAADLERYARFRLTDSGVSALSHPGLEGGTYLASGIEHLEDGSPTASGEAHLRMNEKRFRKLRPLQRRRDLFRVEGDADAPLALLSWGSTAGICREALELARADGLRAKLLIPILLFPVAEAIYREFFASVKAGLVVEQSHQGQLYRILRMYLDLPAGVRMLARSGANPFLPAEVAGRLHECAADLRQRTAPALQPQE